MLNKDFAQIRVECLEANLALTKAGLVDMTFGNASVFEPNLNVFAIKPSGVPYDQLTSNDMVVVDTAGNVVKGDLRPSSDTPTHRHLFVAFGHLGLRAIVHTHSRSAVGFAQAGHSIPCYGTTHADFFNGAVPVTRQMTEAEVAGEYEWETGKVIVEAFEDLDPMQIPAVLVRNHGPFVWAGSGAKAVENAIALELVADMAMKTRTITPDAIANSEAPSYLRQKHFARKHGESAYYGQDN